MTHTAYEFAAHAVRTAAGRCAEAGEHTLAARLRQDAEDLDRKEAQGDRK